MKTSRILFVVSLLVVLLASACARGTPSTDLIVADGSKNAAATAYPAAGTPTGAPTATQTVASTPTAVPTLAATKVPAATSTPAPTAVPTLAATPTTVAGGPEVFSYTPGGKNYVFGEDKTHDPMDAIPADLMGGQEGWTRIRIAANGQPLAWTFLIRIKATNPIEDMFQWRNATELLMTNQGTTDLSTSVEIQRDFLAQGKHLAKDGVDYGCGSCTPYTDANRDKSPLGLGWHITGSLATVTVNGAPAQDLKGLGVYQMNFPADFKGIWTIVVTMKPGSQVTLNQGERLTSVDTWPLPAAK